MRYLEKYLSSVISLNSPVEYVEELYWSSCLCRLEIANLHSTEKGLGRFLLIVHNNARFFYFLYCGGGEIMHFYEVYKVAIVDIRSNRPPLP